MIQVPPESDSSASTKFFKPFNRSLKDFGSFFSCVPPSDEDSVSDLPAFSSSVQSIVEVSMVKPPNLIVIRREQKNRPLGRSHSAGLCPETFLGFLPRIGWLITTQGTAALCARLPNPFGLLLMLIDVTVKLMGKSIRIHRCRAGTPMKSMRPRG